jgi:hypothetical protein
MYNGVKAMIEKEKEMTPKSAPVVENVQKEHQEDKKKEEH